MGRLRAIARRCVPYGVRLRIALLRRAWRDRRARVLFATRSQDEPLPFTHAAYEGPMIDYPGQGGLARAKRHNQLVLASALDGTVISPGETFSLWRVAGRPTAGAGYADAAALRAGRLTSEMGGSTCLLSTVVYNAALLAGLEIVERHCHSVDVYGSERYYELGRDCTIVYGYRDLRFRNPFAYSLRLSVAVEPECVRSTITGSRPRDFTVDLRVSAPIRESRRTRIVVDPTLPPGAEVVVEPGHDGLRTHTSRTIVWRDGTRREDDLGESHHLSMPRVVARAAGGS